jgi:hypothetical protein
MNPGVFGFPVQGDATQAGLTVPTENRVLGGRQAGGPVELLQAGYLAVFATRATAGTNIFPNATNVICPWDNIKYNPYQWTIKNNTDFVIPQGVRRIRVAFTVAIDGSTHPSVSSVAQAYSALFFYDSSDVLVNVAIGLSQPGFDVYVPVSFIADVKPNWYVQAVIAHQNGSTRTYKSSVSLEQSFLAIEVMA